MCHDFHKKVLFYYNFFKIDKQSLLFYDSNSKNKGHGRSMYMNNRKVAFIFKAFCDEHRIEILEILKEGEHCACELLDKLQISQSTLSHHMKILIDSGIVASKKDGKWMHYHIDREGCEEAIALIQYFEDTKERTPSCCK